MLSFEQALDTVKEKVSVCPEPGREFVPLTDAGGRVLAEDVLADRDYPPFHRSIRDGYALRAGDVAAPPANLKVRGEIAAGGHYAGTVEAGECVAIMTGAPLPEGADAVVMVEYTESEGDAITIKRSVQPSENVVRQGSEARAGACVLSRGRRLDAAELGLLASVGKSAVQVFARPRVAILPTGDEVVPVERLPEQFQIRNSNSISLRAQVTAAGGIACPLEIAPDRPEALRGLIEAGFGFDLLLLTGGVSAGKYDFVEQVLADLGAEFYFQSVALRPGKPLVFGRAAGKLFFGLPGNPVSTYVNFMLLVRPALAVMSGAPFAPPIFLRARLAKPVQQPIGLTAVFPAQVDYVSGDPWVSRVAWQGSGDLVGVAAANCFMIMHPGQPSPVAGEWVDVILK